MPSCRAASGWNAFTLGTRLTRVTRALKHRNRDQALTLASGLVADWDGGTRLGEALAVFLSVPRFAAHARGALAIVVSDGLERGGPEALSPRWSGSTGSPGRSCGCRRSPPTRLIGPRRGR
jgi:uncharacterized protein with von Willebrand factor type A (vWA) domain